MRLWHLQCVFLIFLIFYPYRSLQICEKFDHLEFAFYIICDHFVIDDIQHSSNWSYDTFIEIRNWNSTEIKPHMFQSWHPLEKFTITSSNIQIIHNEAFDGLNLTHLDLANNTILHIDVEAFSGLQQLSILDLSYNRIGKIENGTFNGLTNLQNGFFNNNNTFLEKGILVNLKELDLSHNSISYIEKEAFYRLHRLRRLNLQNNRIGQLNENNFNGLDNLYVLNLTRNNIVNIETGALNGLQYLNQFDLSYNNLSITRKDTFTPLLRLEVLYLRNNRISKLPVGCFQHLNELSYLDLSFNNISSLDLGIFGGLYNLRYLNLSHNYLTTFEKGIFHDIDRILTLDISYNNFVYIDVETTLSHIVSRDTEIYLEGNQWSCSVLTKIITQNKNLNIQQASAHNVTNIKGNYCTNEEHQIAEHVESNESQEFDLTTTTAKANGAQKDQLEQFQENVNTSKDKEIKLPNPLINDDIDKIYKTIEDRMDLRVEESNRRLAVVEDLLIFLCVLLTITVIVLVGEKCLRYLPFKFVSCRPSNSDTDQEIELIS